MPTKHCDQIALDTSSPDGEILWRRLCALTRHQGVDAPARYYRNKLAQEGLTELEYQQALEMLNNWGNQ